MSLAISSYAGDAEYRINATGDCCIGDHVRFDQATFGGSYRKPTFAGFRLVTGEIIRDSYGADKQQHTFTLRLEDGSEMRIKVYGERMKLTLGDETGLKLARQHDVIVIPHGTMTTDNAKHPWCAEGFENQQNTLALLREFGYIN